MNPDQLTTVEEVPRCENCPAVKKAEQNPKSFWARVWRWHTGWCPGWKAYQKYLATHPGS
jgi:hypothetical protein